MNQGHPDLGPNLVGTCLGPLIADVSTFDAVPDALSTSGPLDQAVHSFRHVPEEVGAVGPIETGDGIDVERNDVGSLDVGRIIAETRTRARSNPLVVSHALGEVEHDGTSRIGVAESPVLYCD